MMGGVFDQIFQVGFLAALVRIATPLIFATLGEMFSERAGVLNLGIEGIMLISAMTGFSAAYFPAICGSASPPRWQRARRSDSCTRC